ncbi:MAG: EpsD family peptidyl-prolyl cis-trans isomerase [Telluria sp.]
MRTRDLHHATVRQLRCVVLILSMAALAACGNKPKDSKPGQALASVNGAEITVLQLNEELQRAGVGPAQQETASKQLLQALIDRQLLQNAAAAEKLDRDPKVMQAVERAKALIVAQQYMQHRIGNVPRPTRAEVEAYFNNNPQFFIRRKQFSLQELVLASADLTPQLKAAADAARSLDDIAAWMEANKVKFGRTQVTRSTTDLSPEMAARLLGMQKGQLFIVKEGERSLIISIAEVRDAPVTLDVAAQQIEQFLINKRNKERAAAELARLRASARIEYLNKSMALDATPAAGSPAATPGVVPAVAPAPTAPGATAPSAPTRAALERGAAGLK